MSSPNNQRRQYVDMVVKPRTHTPIGPQPSVIEHISPQAENFIIERHNRRILAKRIKRVARIAIVASKNNLTVRQLRIRLLKTKTVRTIHAAHANQYRLITAGMVCFVAIGTLIAPFIQATDTSPIILPSNVQALLGDSRDDAKTYLKYEEAKHAYSFEVPKDTSDTNFQHAGRNADAYTTTLGQSADDGIVVTDSKTSIAVSLKPHFFTASARKSTANNIVYRSGNKQLIYTLKYNGLKEDIIIPNFQQATQEYSFSLKLPVGVEARLDDQGNIGIYSGDSSLYGNISYGTDKDRELVDKAREKSAKTNLLMTIPAPIVKEASGTELTDRAHFEISPPKTVKEKPPLQQNVPEEVAKKLSETSTLNEYRLTLKAYNLRDLTYPISLDPTLQVTSAGDFNNMDLTDNVEVDNTNNLIKRASLTGASVGTWNTSVAMKNSTNRFFHQMVAYNGFLYVSGGRSNTVGAFSDTIYAKINSNGTIGAWQDGPTMPTARHRHAMAAYNGYMYITGGCTTGFDCLDVYTSVYYAKINANGSLNTWQTSIQNMQTGRRQPGMVIQKGVLYVAGGVDGSANGLATVEQATILGNGETSAWTNATSMPTSRDGFGMVSYKDTIYAVGGATGCCFLNSIIQTRINTDGSLAAWQTSSATLSTQRAHATTTIYNGYMYVVGGYNNPLAMTNIVEVFPVHVDGTLGSAFRTTAFSTPRRSVGLAAYNGYLILTGGTSDAPGPAPTFFNDTQYAQIQPPGTVSATTASADFDSSGREGAAILAAQNHIWLFGGFDGTSYLSSIRKVTINSDGTIGTWTTDSGVTLPKAKAYMGITSAPNGAVVNLYGGYGNCGLLNQVDYCNDWEVGGYASNGAINSFTTSVVNLPTARRGLSAVFNHGTVYLLGGQDSNGVLSSVLRAKPTSGAGLTDAGCGTTAWCTDVAFANARTDATATHDNNYIYLIGGRNSGTYYRTVQYALINTNSGNRILSTNSCGTSVTWCTSSSINVDRSAHSAYVRNGYMYIAGGCNTGTGCTADLNSIEFAPVNGANGSLGLWTANNQSFITGRSYPMIAHFDGFMYILGGNTGTLPAKDVQYAYVGNGGSGRLSSFNTPAGAVLTSARTSNAGAVYNGYLYTVGGCTAFASGACSTIINTIEYAKINSDGSLSSNTCGSSTTWCTTTAMLDTTYGGSVNVYAGYLYYMGGTNSTGTTANIDSIAINIDGSLAASWNSPNNPPDMVAPRTRFNTAASNNYIYAAGGFDASGVEIATGEYAQLLPNGTLGSWTSFSVPGQPTGKALVFITAGRLYKVGGGQSVTGFHNLLNGDGSPNSSWTQQPWIDDFPTEPVGFVANGFLYYGAGSLTRLNILSAGGIEPVPDSTYSAGVSHESGAGAYDNGFFYELGGCTAGTGLNCTAVTNSVQYVGQQAISRDGSFSKLYDFEAGVKPTKLITRGSRGIAAGLSIRYKTTNNTGTSLDNEQTVETINYTGTNASTFSLGTNRTLSRYLLLQYTFSDSRSAAYPDVGLESKITDFDLYYIANPGARLRGGRTFTNGVDRGLDVQPQ